MRYLSASTLPIANGHGAMRSEALAGIATIMDQTGREGHPRVVTRVDRLAKGVDSQEVLGSAVRVKAAVIRRGRHRHGDCTRGSRLR